MHSDAWVVPSISKNGYQYYIHFVDEKVGINEFTFLKQNLQFYKHSFNSKLRLNNKLVTKLKSSKVITPTSLIILHHTSYPFAHEKNEIVEKKHHHIIELSLSIITHVLHYLINFWLKFSTKYIFYKSIAYTYYSLQVPC